MMTNEEIITKVCKPMQEAGMRLLGYHDVANAVNSAIIIAKKDVFDDIDKLLFDKHFYRDVYVRWKICASEYSELKRRHIK